MKVRDKTILLHKHTIRFSSRVITIITQTLRTLKFALKMTRGASRLHNTTKNPITRYETRRQAVYRHPHRLHRHTVWSHRHAELGRWPHLVDRTKQI